MTTHDDQAPSRLWRDLALIVALMAVLTVPSILTRDLWFPDEPRYMEVAREVFVLHDYVVPHLNGEVYAEKPPLFFWLTGLLWKAGLGLDAGRVLAALASLGMLLGTYFFSRRVLSGDGPILAAMATLGLYLFAANARQGTLDPLLALLASSAILCGYMALHAAGRRPWLWWLGAYALAGLAVLAKGPVGLALPAIVLLTYGLLERRRVSGGGMAHLAGIALCAAIVMAWLVPAIVIGGKEYARTILVKQNVGRVVGAASHQNPSYYYILKGPALLLPWTLLLPSAFYAAIKRDRIERGGPALLAVVWLGATLAFFSCVAGKRTDYLLPIAPAAGILMAWYLTDGRKANTWLVKITLGALGLGAVALMVLTFYPEHFARLVTVRPHPAAGLQELLGLRWRLVALALLSLPLGCCIAGWFWAQGHIRRAAVALALAAVLLTTWYDISVAPGLNRDRSARTFCEAVASHVGAQDELYFHEQPFAGIVNLYLGRAHIPVLDDPQQLRAALGNPNVLVLGDEKPLSDALPGVALDRYIVLRSTLGHWQMTLLRGAAPGP